MGAGSGGRGEQEPIKGGDGVIEGVSCGTTRPVRGLGRTAQLTVEVITTLSRKSASVTCAGLKEAKRQRLVN